MLTKEDLSSMKYKELVVIAKQYGVYKSRSKKVTLLNKLLSLPFDQVVNNPNIPVEDQSDSKLVNTSQKNNCFENMINASPANLRRETFDIVPCTEGRDGSKAVENDFRNVIGDEIMDHNVPSNRRETFDIDKDQSDSKLVNNSQKNSCFENNSRISVAEDILQINSDKDKTYGETVTPKTPLLRQGTFNIDKSIKNNKFEEMPGILSNEFKNNPVKPYIINGAATCSPVRTRNSIHRSASSVKSIGRRIESQRIAKSERRPSSRGSKTQKSFPVTLQASSTPVRLHKTAVKGGRIEKKITPSKLPNFKAIHLREFSKMESIVEHTKRKEERTKALLTPLKLIPTNENKPKGKALVTSRIPVKFDLPTTVVEPKSTSFTPAKGKQSVTSQTHKNINLRKSCVSNIKDKLKFIDSPMTKIKRKSEPNAVRDITNKIVSNPKKRVENVKEIVSSKMHPFSVERNRAKGRDFLQSVRMNRRFQLQMEVMRKAKV